MKILGICNDETASACLMVDGEVVCAVSEERFTRVKLDNSFPLNAIRFCLDYSNIGLADVDVVAYAWSKGFDPNLAQIYLNTGSQYSGDEHALETIRERLRIEIERDREKRAEFDKWVSENIDQKSQIVVDFYHHEAHAASASLLSPFDDGYVYTSDARGDFEAVTLYKFERYSSQQLIKIFSSTSSESFGFYYGRITGLLGFKPMRHEGKVTGLAAYGDSKNALSLCKKMMDVSDGRVVANIGDYYRPFFAPYSEALKEKIDQFSKEDIAAAAQEHLETMMTNLLGFHLEKAGANNVNLMCAGGVFGNVKITQRLKEMDAVGEVYVQPQMGDGGLCIGACALANESFSNPKTSKKRTTKELRSMYLGPEAKYRERTQESYSEEFHLQNYTIREGVSALVEALRRNKVIGLINGRMEFGPRALCNRSIIVKTSDKSVNDWLNRRLSRTEFMPFAPVLRAEVADKCIKNYRASDVTLNFMTSTVDCTEEFERNNPAVVHVDHTARPQVVTEKSNNFIWEVLRLWEIESEETSLVNTSFNIHEEPIIQDVDEGLISLRKGVIDQLWHVTGRDVLVYSNR